MANICIMLGQTVTNSHGTNSCLFIVIYIATNLLKGICLITKCYFFLAVGRLNLYTEKYSLMPYACFKYIQLLNNLESNRSGLQVLIAFITVLCKPCVMVCHGVILNIIGTNGLLKRTLVGNAEFLSLRSV